MKRTLFQTCALHQHVVINIFLVATCGDGPLTLQLRQIARLLKQQPMADKTMFHINFEDVMKNVMAEPAVAGSTQQSKRPRTAAVTAKTASASVLAAVKVSVKIVHKEDVPLIAEATGPRKPVGEPRAVGTTSKTIVIHHPPTPHVSDILCKPSCSAPQNQSNSGAADNLKMLANLASTKKKEEVEPDLLCHEEMSEEGPDDFIEDDEDMASAAASEDRNIGHCISIQHIKALMMTEDNLFEGRGISVLFLATKLIHITKVYYMQYQDTLTHTNTKTFYISGYMSLEEILFHTMALVECHNVLEGHCSDVMKGVATTRVVRLSIEVFFRFIENIGITLNV